MPRASNGPLQQVQYDKYYTPVPSQPSSAAQAPPSNVQYGHAWMVAAVKEHQESDHAMLTSHADLQASHWSLLMMLGGGGYVLAS